MWWSKRSRKPVNRLSGISTTDGINLMLTCSKCGKTETRRLIYPEQGKFDEVVAEAKRVGRASLKLKGGEQVTVPISWQYTGTEGGSLFKRCAKCFRVVCYHCASGGCPFCGSYEAVDATAIVVRKHE